MPHQVLIFNNYLLITCLYPRRGHDVLKDQLPSKEEHVILVRLSPLQRALYTEFMNRFREAGNTGWLSLNPLKAFCVCCKVRRRVCVSQATLRWNDLHLFLYNLDPYKVQIT